MKTETFEEFEARARAQGLDEVLERDGKPATVLDERASAESPR